MNTFPVRTVRPMRALFLLCAVFLFACQPEQGAKHKGHDAKLLPTPDLSHMEQSTSFPLDKREELEQRIKDPNTIPANRAESYGKLGMLYHAYHLSNAALTCYLNAGSHAPNNARWQHLAGTIYREWGQHEQAVTAFKKAVALEPTNAAGVLALAELQHLDHHFSEARASYERALTLNPKETAALIGLGKLEHDERNYPEAIALFERALIADPMASMIHYLLALSHRASGQMELAQAHMAKRGDGQPELSDPLLLEIATLRGDADSLRRKGDDAARSGQFDRALDFYNDALKANPRDPRTWHNAAWAHLNKNDLAAASTAYQKTTELAENPALRAAAFHSLGSIAIRTGGDGLEFFQAALAAMPEHVGSHFYLGEISRGRDRFEEALAHYQKAVSLKPDLVEARMGRAVCLIRLGHWREALATLGEDARTVSDQPAFHHITARLLATVPVAELRDGTRSLEITAMLMETMNNSDLSGTRAMAFAEMGRYDEAIKVQSQAIAQAVEEGRPVAALQKQLLAYRQQKPCRQPWPPDDPFFLQKLH